MNCGSLIWNRGGACMCSYIRDGLVSSKELAMARKYDHPNFETPIANPWLWLNQSKDRPQVFSYHYLTTSAHATNHLKHLTRILANPTDVGHFLKLCGLCVHMVRKKMCGFCLLTPWGTRKRLTSIPVFALHLLQDEYQEYWQALVHQNPSSIFPF